MTTAQQSAALGIVAVALAALAVAWWRTAAAARDTRNEARAAAVEAARAHRRIDNLQRKVREAGVPVTTVPEMRMQVVVTDPDMVAVPPPLGEVPAVHYDPDPDPDSDARGLPLPPVPENTRRPPPPASIYDELRRTGYGLTRP